MKSIHTLIFTTVAAVAILGTVMINVQTVSAPRSCAGCVEFKKLTHEFEKNVIGDLNIAQGPQPHLRELLDAFVRDVNQIFLGGPDTIPGLLEQYQQTVIGIFEEPPEEGAGPGHIKVFRSETHEFEKAVLGLFTGPD